VKLCRATSVAALFAAGLLAAGCGVAASSGAPGTSSAETPGTSPSAESMSQILPAMQASVDSAQSVHVTGTSTEEAQSYTVDLSLAAPGSAAGSVTYEGKALTVVVVRGAV
jgi:ABC-type glycerol-3-phosphate transport system substrate-binding protein